MTTQTNQTNQQVLFAALSAVILPQFHQPAALVTRRETTLARAQLGSVAHCATVPVPFRHPGDWKLYPGKQYDWALMPIEADPLYSDRRGFPMPRPIIDRLRKLHRAGVDFDALWIAHEVERGKLKAGQRLTVADLMPAPQPKRTHWLWPVLGGLAGMIAHSLAPKDPILFGVNVAPAPPPARQVAPRPAPASIVATQRTQAPTVAPEPAPAAVEAPEPQSAAVEPPAPVIEPAQQPVTVEAPAPPAGPRRGIETDTYWENILADGRVQRVPNRDVVVEWEDGSTYIKHDISRPPTITADGRWIYPDEFGNISERWLDTEYLDPILLGVNVTAGIADLFVLGAWAYGAR